MNNNFDYTPQNEQSSFENYGFSPMPPQNQGHAKGYATASMWLGIASLVCTSCCCCLYFLSLILSIISIVMAVLAKRDNGGKMPGMATAGLILAIIGLVLFLCILAIEIAFMAMPDTEFEQIIRESFEEAYGMPFEEYVEEMYGIEAGSSALE